MKSRDTTSRKLFQSEHRNFVAVRTLKTIANFFLALTLLVATTGITLSKHYCMGRLKSVAVFEHAENCMGTSDEDPMPCCKDVTEELKLEEVTTIDFQFDATPALLELALLPSYEEANLAALSTSLHPYSAFDKHPPPPIDVQVDYQVFLI